MRDLSVEIRDKLSLFSQVFAVLRSKTQLSPGRDETLISRVFRCGHCRAPVKQVNAMCQLRVYLSLEAFNA